jgi:hypothetical protein
VGEGGFSQPFTPDTAASFYYRGLYGRGTGEAHGDRHVADLRVLVERRRSLPDLGEFSRQFVVRHFALDTVVRQLADVCRLAASESSPIHMAVVDGLRTSAVLLRERRLLSYRFWEQFER